MNVSSSSNKKNNSNNNSDNNYDKNDNDNNNDIERRTPRFLTISSLRREVSNTYTPVARASVECKSRATHRALITCSVSCATWYKGTAQLLSLTEVKSHSF